MCRHLAYVGPPVALSRLLLEPPHALVHQAAAPRDMRGGGTVNADGFGIGWYPVGWYPEPDTSPRCYHRDRPAWTDAELPRLAADVHATAVCAAVRSATPGMAVTEAACAPFTDGRWLFSLNGRVPGWPDTVAGLAARLPVADLLTLPAPVDTALVWALVRHRRRAGEPAAQAVADTVAEVAAAAPGSRLNVLLTDGTTVIATTVTHALSWWRGDGAVLLASEPLDDDPAWQPVPDGRLVVADPSRVETTPLSLPAP